MLNTVKTYRTYRSMQPRFSSASLAIWRCDTHYVFYRSLLAECRLHRARYVDKSESKKTEKARAARSKERRERRALSVVDASVKDIYGRENAKSSFPTGVLWTKYKSTCRQQVYFRCLDTSYRRKKILTIHEEIELLRKEDFEDYSVATIDER